MAAELALLRRRLAVCGAGDDVPAMLNAAYEAFEYLAAAVQAGSVFAASVVAAAPAADGRGSRPWRHRCCQPARPALISSPPTSLVLPGRRG